MQLNKKSCCRHPLLRFPNSRGELTSSELVDQERINLTTLIERNPGMMELI